MPILNEIHKHVCALGQKLTSQNMQHPGQKMMRTGNVIGRKVSNTLTKIENIGHAALPVLQTASTMAGFPEVSALASAGKGLSRISQMRNNVDTVRRMIIQYLNQFIFYVQYKQTIKHVISSSRPTQF